MRKNDLLEDDIDLKELASLTKNFSGAEIAGLIKSASSFAFNRHVKVISSADLFFRLGIKQRLHLILIK